jgi:mRNA interferase MazF
MTHTGPVRRWDTFWTNLEPGIGSEQKGDRRPVVVISNDGFNAAFSVVTVISATKAEGKRRSAYAFEVLLPKGSITPRHASIVMPHQLRTISKLRLLTRIGTLPPEFRAQIELRLLEHLGIAFEEESV